MAAWTTIGWPFKLKMNLVNSILTLVSFVGMIFFLLAPLLVEDCYLFLIYPIILMTTLLTWALIHEGIHNNLFKRVRLNNLGARMLSIAFGTAFYGVSEAHLAHHKFNRSELERPDILDEAEHKSSSVSDKQEDV